MINYCRKFQFYKTVFPYCNAAPLLRRNTVGANPSSITVLWKIFSGMEISKLSVVYYSTHTAIDNDWIRLSAGAEQLLRRTTVAQKQ